MFLNVLIAVIIIFALCVFVGAFINRNMPLKKGLSESQYYMYLVLLSILLCYWITLWKLSYHLNFQQKIERYLCDLFPHSNNENYIRTNIPVSNNIRTN